MLNITKENNSLILKIPLEEQYTETYSENVNYTPSICGLKWGNEFSIAHLNFLDYKDAFQCGAPIIMLESEEELDSICKEFCLIKFSYENCNKCNKVLTGLFTIDDNGKLICLEHEE